MPTLESNRAHWAENGSYEWPDAGEEWSIPWGGTDNLWRTMLEPRLSGILPVDVCVEIACGYGRITTYLAPRCRRLIAVDIGENCVAACCERFAMSPHVEVYLNDGYTLPTVADRSVDLVFSFDSLVHVDEQVMRSYLREIRRVLRRGGRAVLHHSNLAAQRRALWYSRRLGRCGRDTTVSGALVTEWARAADLSVDSVEPITWPTISRRVPSDCITSLTAES